MRIINISNGDPDEYILEFAKELHANYRAAFKALHKYDVCSYACRDQHDHGWVRCHKKAYFIRRAKHVLKGREVRACVPF